MGGTREGGWQFVEFDNNLTLCRCLRLSAALGGALQGSAARGNLSRKAWDEGNNTSSSRENGRERTNIKEVSDECEQAMMMANTALRYNQQVATATNALSLEWI